MLMGAVLAVHDESELKTAQTELKALYDREHRISETLQRSLLMMPPRDAFPNVTVESLYAAAWDEAQVGGDFCDALALGEGKVGLIVGDVAGKGLAAAARTAEIKFTLRTFLRENHDPATAIKRVNDMLATSLETNEFGDPTIVSLAVAVMETNTGEVHFSAAGSEPALIIRANGTAEPAPSSGLPLGAFVDSEFETTTLQIHRGDILMMVTDGITEARRSHEFFGYEGLTRLALQARGLPTLQQVAMAILDGAQAFAGGRLQDDACIILARRR
jgi:serine phosphatase RsbU (regulator of sigma subunit)